MQVETGRTRPPDPCVIPAISLIHNMLVQTLQFTKLIDVLHVHLLGGRQAERQALSLGVINCGVGFRIQRRFVTAYAGSEGKEEDRGSPVFIPSTWYICDSYERSGAGTVRNAGESSRRALWEQAYAVTNAHKAGSQRSFFFRDLTLHALLSSRPHIVCTVCIPSNDVPFAGRNTQPVMRSALAQVLSFVSTLRHCGAYF